MRIAGLNLAEFFAQAARSPDMGNTQAVGPVAGVVRSDGANSVANKRVIDAEILTRSTASPLPLEQQNNIDSQPESLVQQQLHNSSSDQRIVRYLETQFGSDHNADPSFFLDTYA